MDDALNNGNGETEERMKKTVPSSSSSSMNERMKSTTTSTINLEAWIKINSMFHGTYELIYINEWMKKREDGILNK